MIKQLKKNYNLSDEDLERLDKEIGSWTQEEDNEDIIFLLDLIKTNCKNLIKKEKYKNIVILVLLCKLTNLEITDYINL